MVKSYTIPCTKKEMSSLINAAKEDDFCYSLFMIAKTTGRLIGEIYTIKVKDFHFKNNLVYIKEKKAILSPEVSELLQNYIIKNEMKLNDYVFRKVSVRQIQEKMKFFTKKAGIKHKVTFHNFRHYLITNLMKQGWDPVKISKITGHITIGTLTSYYDEKALDVRKDILKALEKM